MTINTITKTINGNKYEFFSVHGILVNGYFDIIKYNSIVDTEKIDLFISNKINNWRNVVVEIVSIHLMALGEYVKSFNQDVQNRLSLFLIDTLLDCKYEQYYQIIKLLDYISKTNNNSIVFCYNNDKPVMLKLKKDW